MQLKLFTATSIAALTLASVGAQAQTMDYGSLETLFGEPVTTSATGSPQKATDAPVDMEIITADDIRRSGARDIPGVLKHVAGVDVSQWASNNYDVGVQGYNQAYSSRLLLLIDGRQVYADYYGFTPWTTLPVELNEIRQIEIVRGPNSALFGFNAVGGVINIVTYSPLYDNANSVQLLGGTQGLAEGSAVATAKIGDWLGLRIGMGAYGGDDFDTPQAASDVGTRRGENRGEINVAATMRITDKIQASLEATHSESDLVETIPNYSQEYDRYGTWSIKGLISADTAAGLLQASVYSNWIRDDDFAGSSTTGALSNTNQVTVVQLQDLYRIDTDLTVRPSFEYRHNTASSSSINGAHIFYDVLSPSVMLDWKISPTLDLTNAVRLDHLMLGRDGYIAPGPFTNASWNLTVDQPSFNSGLVWHAGGQDTIRATAARGVEMPNFVQLGTAAIHVPGIFLGGVPTVQPTVVMNYELGWDHQIPAIDGILRVSAFHQTSDGLSALFARIIFSPTNGLEVLSSNIGNSKAEGLNLELKGKIGQDWRWGLSYTPEIVTDHLDPTADLAAADTDFQHTTPNHIVKANVGWASGPWEADLFGQYQSGAYGLITLPGGVGSALTKIDGYADFDARVAYKATDWLTLSLSGQNITESTQRQTSQPDVERTVFGALTANF